mgnify:CR=1 FL=1
MNLKKSNTDDEHEHIMQITESLTKTYKPVHVGRFLKDEVLAPESAIHVFAPVVPADLVYPSAHVTLQPIFCVVLAWQPALFVRPVAAAGTLHVDAVHVGRFLKDEVIAPESAVHVFTPVVPADLV